jgi:3-phenylpropionate/trans-cinnamate dioxygenase ferredoxin reductase subunit
VSGTLVVGASHAGIQLATALREIGDREPVTVVGAESLAPYQRPPLSKAFLHGTADTASLAFRTPAFYAEREITVLTGERVVDVSPTGATTDRGRHLAFDRLALTVGARVRMLRVPGAGLAGVHHLRDVADATRLRRALTGATSVVVIGGGFIGLEVAAAARALGRPVTVVEAADRLIPRAVAPVVSEFYRQAHERRGTAVLLGAAVTAVTGERGRATGVLLADGGHLPADVVVVGIGIVPRTELAEQLGLSCDRGIVVDRCARTSAPGVVAAGDCTVVGADRLRFESVQHATAQARAGAAALLGREEPVTEVPWFWSDQHDLKLQIAGLSAGHDDIVVRGNPDSERFSVLYYRDGALLAIDAVNATADYLTVRKALATGATIPAEHARRADRRLKEMLVASLDA